MNKFMMVALCLVVVGCGRVETVVIGSGNEEIDSGTADADAATEPAADNSGSDASPDAGGAGTDAAEIDAVGEVR